MKKQPSDEDTSYLDDMTSDKAFEMINVIPLITQRLFTEIKNGRMLYISDSNSEKIYLNRKNFPSKNFNLLVYMGEIYDKFYVFWTNEQKQVAGLTIQKYQKLISKNPKRCRIIFPNSGPT
jgi:hypothetical protein